MPRPEHSAGPTAGLFAGGKTSKVGSGFPAFAFFWSQPMSIRLALFALFALTGLGNAHADIYKCRTSDGRVEIANTPCASPTSTLKSSREEPVSEASRQQAERDVARMRDYVDKREAAQRADAAAEREAQAQAQARQQAATNKSAGQPLDECLREVERQTLEANQRAQMEAACRANASAAPVYVPVPVYGPVYGNDNPAGLCVQNVMRQNLPAAERQRRLAQCQGSSVSIQIGTGHHPEPRPQPPVKPTPPAAPTLATPPCPAGKTNCR
jgi:hypothetical protein